MINVDEVKKLAQLARIEMSEEEMGNFAVEIDSILGYVDQIKQTVGVEGERQVGELHNVTRGDNQPNTRASTTPELVAEFPKKEGNYLKVKKIL